MPDPKYKPVCCYQCGEPFRAYTFNDVWDMRIDGKLHKVPVYAVPVMRCDVCDLAVTDSGSDEAIAWARKEYLRKNNMNTPWLLFWRWIRRQCNLWYYWHWNRSPWARWTWAKGECPARVLNRRWWQIW